MLSLKQIIMQPLTLDGEYDKRVCQLISSIMGLLPRPNSSSGRPKQHGMVRRGGVTCDQAIKDTTERYQSWYRLEQLFAPFVRSSSLRIAFEAPRRQRRWRAAWFSRLMILGGHVTFTTEL